jgi:hypothetical protein
MSALRPSRLQRFLRWWKDSRGAVAVEAALITPLLVTILFGIIEVGLLMRDDLSFNQAARAGARAASAMPRSDDYQSAAANAVAGALRGISPSTVQSLTIFRADPATGKPLNGADPQTCTIDCVRFTWDKATMKFLPVNGTSWPAADQHACGDEADTDYLGIQLQGFHPWLTRLFGSGVTVQEKAVMRLEPILAAGECQ